MTQPHSKPVSFADTQASVLFDLLRGLAALVVLVGHWRNLFFIDFPQVTAHRSLLAVFYILAAAGHQAVIVFFVLSGYFIGGAVFRAFDRNQWSWPSYLLHRGVRLWTVLLPALLLCLLWDRLGIHLGHAPALYAGQVDNHLLRNVRTVLTPRIFLGNLFFLQNIRVPAFGSDGPLWSLANEFWYYILFPLAAVAFCRRGSVRHRLLVAALFLLIVCAMRGRGGILASFPIWLAGATLYKLPPPRLAPALARRLCLAAAIVYTPIFFALARVPVISYLFNDYLLGAITFLFFWLLLSLRSAYAPHARSVRASRGLARFSYTLYAVHLPWLVLIVSLVLGDTRWTPTPLHLLAALGPLLAALLYAYGIAFLTEFRTDRLRRRLERLFHLHSTAPELPSNPLKL